MDLIKFNSNNPEYEEWNCFHAKHLTITANHSANIPKPTKRSSDAQINCYYFTAQYADHNKV